MRKVFDVEGMHCESCGKLIEQDLLEIPGVSKAVADYKTGRVSMDYAGDEVSVAKAKKAIQDLGYKVR